MHLLRQMQRWNNLLPKFVTFSYPVVLASFVTGNTPFPRLLVGSTHLKAGNRAEGADLRREQAAIWAEHLKQKLASEGAIPDAITHAYYFSPAEEKDQKSCPDSCP